MNPDDLEQRVRSRLPEDIPHRNVLVAVSGGADSVCLLRVLHRLRDAVPFSLITGHLNHGWRGAESDADAEFVRELCDTLQIPIVIDKSETTDPNEQSESSARDARYRFLHRVSAERDCAVVVAGHTADDQVETILHHILRGTGLAGLRGIPADRTLRSQEESRPMQSTVRLIRPLLRTRRTEIEAYLSAIGQPFRHDATNRDGQFTRNRIRHTLLPLLREQFNPKVDEALLRLVHQARNAMDIIESLGNRLLNDALLEMTSTVCRLRRERLRDSDPELVRTALMQLWKRTGWPRQRMSYEDWHRLADLAANDGTETLPGRIDARTNGGVLILRRDFANEPRP